MGGLQHLLGNICEVKKTNKQKPIQKNRDLIVDRHRDRIRRVTDAAAAAAQQNCTGDPFAELPSSTATAMQRHSVRERERERELAHSETLGCAKP